MEMTEHFSHNSVRVTIKGGFSFEAWAFLFPIIQQILMSDIWEVQLNLQEIDTIDNDGWALLELLDSILKGREGQLIFVDSKGHVPSSQLHLNFSIFTSL